MALAISDYDVSADAPLSRSGRAYLLIAIDQYRNFPSLTLDPTAAAAAAKIVDAAEATDGNLIWNDLFHFEQFLIRLAPPEQITAWAFDIRERCKNVIGADAYAARFKPIESDLKNGYTAALRVELLVLEETRHRAYVRFAGQERAREQFSTRVQLWATIALVVLAAATGLGIIGGTYPTALMIVLAGAIGALFSLLQRVQKVPAEADGIKNLVAIEAARRDMFIAPLSGMIGALVLYMLFAGAFVTGALFPTIATGADSKTGYRMIDFLVHTGPADALAAAKLILWSFLAGFSERLVPDAIDRVAGKLK
jgi:hypothetical protein